jgi:trehalose synthase
VLAGSWPSDDPEGRRIVEEVEDEVGGDPDIFVLINPADMEVNVSRRSADVVLQKSLKEGLASWSPKR